MTIQQQNSNDEKNFSQLSAQLANLKSINNINFTSKEIDIIAYLLGGRATKKIASFMGTSPKTVENHFRNIMLKIGCNSRENIIDFIEKTDKFALVKKHYTDLLIRITFEQELKKISTAIKLKRLSCIIFHHRIQKTKDLFISQLEKHLEIAGIKVISKIWEPYQAKTYLTNVASSEPINCCIYSMSNEFIEQLQIKHYDLQTEAANLIPMVKKNHCSIVFLLANENCQLYFQQTLSSFAKINLAEQKNYYLVIFKILQTLLPSYNIDQHIAEFKKNCTIFFDHTSLQPNCNKILKSEITQNKLHLHFKKSLVLGSTIFFLLLIFCGITIYKVNITKAKQANKSVDLETSFTSSNLNPTLKYETSETTLNLPIRNFKFPGRALALTKIKDQFNLITDKPTDNMITQVIAGIDGIGKTQLAIEFALQSRKENNYDAILWVAASTHDSIKHSYKIFANHFQLETNEANLTRMQALVYMKLAEKFKGKRILLILDKAENNPLIKDYLATLRDQLSPYTTLHVLITSISQDWEVESLVLDVFTPEEAAEFIKTQLPSEKNDSIAKLGKSLNYFPLALCQAVAYIKTHSNIDDYLEAYAAKKVDYLNISDSNNPHVAPLWKTWNIALSKLNNNARELLYISAYLDPDNIPLELFTHLTAEERMLAIGDLRKHSFITLSHNNKSFKIHRLLQEVIRLTTRKYSTNTYVNTFKNKIFGTEPWLTKALDLIENNFDFNYLQIKNWKIWNQYLTNTRIAAEHATTYNGNTFRRGIKLYAKVAMFVTHSLIESEESSYIWLKLLKLIEKNHNNPLLLANINTHLGVANRTNRMVNNISNAESSLNKAIAIYLDHPIKTTKTEDELLNILRLIPLPNNITLPKAIKYDLGYALTQLGNIYHCEVKYDAAILTYNKALATFNDIKDIDSVKYNNVDTLYNLGRSLMFSGKFDMAENPIKTAKQIADQIYIGHQQQALTYKILAIFNNHIGKYKEANKLFLAGLHLLYTIAPKEQSLFNMSNVDIGSTAYMAGNIKQAKKILETPVPYKYLFNSTRSLWLSKFYLGRIYENLGEYQQAATLLKESVMIAENYYKKTLHDYMAFQISRAEYWHKLDKGSNVAYWQQALKLTIKLFGSNHYQTARYQCLLGQALANSGQIKLAKVQYANATLILTTEKINHPDLVKFHEQNLQLVQELASK